MKKDSIICFKVEKEFKDSLWNICRATLEDSLSHCIRRFLIAYIKMLVSKSKRK